MTPEVSLKKSAPVGVLSAMMFLQFFVWGAWYVSMTGWINEAGLGGLTALAYSVCPIAAIVSPLFLGMVADRFFASQKVLGCLHLAGAGFMLALPLVVGGGAAGGAERGFFHPFILLLLGHALCYMPTLGLSSSVAFNHIANPEKVFPIIRVFGTVGWIVGNICVTLLPGGDKSAGQFYLAGAAGAALGLLSFRLPRTPPPLAGRKTSLREIFGVDALALLKQRNYLVFIACSFLICIPLAGYYQQARNFVDFAGFEAPTFIMSFGQMSEIFFMLVMPLCFARFGVKKMLLIGMFAWVARYGLFAGAAPSQWHLPVILAVLLHGICYDFFFVTGQIYVDKAAPHAIRGQAQGMLVLVTQGLGMIVGAFVFGKLVEVFQSPVPGGTPDWRGIWLWPAVSAAVIAVVFLIFFRERKDDATPASSLAE